MRISASLGFIMIGAVLASGREPSQNTSSSPTRLSVIRGFPIATSVYLNGQGPYRFLLDTGAETNQMDVGLARKLGIAPSFRVDLDTAAGTTQVAGAWVAEVGLGTAHASDQEFLL